MSYTRVGSKSYNPDRVPHRLASVHHRDIPPQQIRVSSCITVTSAPIPKNFTDDFKFSDGPSTINEIAGNVRGDRRIGVP